MVVQLKQSTLFVVQAIPQPCQTNPEVTFNGQWLAEKISDNIENLIEIGLSARGIVTGQSFGSYQCVFSTEKYSIQNEIVV